MKFKTGQFPFIILYAIFSVFTCAYRDPIDTNDRKLSISGISDTSVSVNDSISIPLRADSPGLTDVRFSWKIIELNISDTVHDSILTIAFKNTGDFNVVISATTETGLVSGPDTFLMKVYAKSPAIKIMKTDSIYSVNDSVMFSVSSYDSDGVVKNYLWSLDGMIFDTTISPQYKHVWNSDGFGDKTLYVKCTDDDGIVSAMDSTSITVLPKDTVSFIEVFMNCMDRVSICGTTTAVITTQASFDSLRYEKFQKPLDDYWNRNYDTALYYAKRNNPGLSDWQYAEIAKGYIYEALPFRGTDTCHDAVIDFNKYTLLEMSANAGGCTYPDYYITVSRNDNEKKIFCRIKIIEHGFCDMGICCNKWICIPKISLDYSVVFERQYSLDSTWSR